MKISKHVHSCLLVENQGKVVLIDPGDYSYEERALSISSLNQLDAITITHEHQDHMHIPWIKEILKKFPNTPIFTTNSAQYILKQEGITNVQEKGNDFISLEPIPHERIWTGSPVENVKITLFGMLATVGDSLTFNTTPDILAIGIQGPWGSMTQAVERAIQVKPKVVIPVHDFHLKDEFRKQYYQRLKDYFRQNGIDFKPAETNEIIEV